MEIKLLDNIEGAYKLYDSIAQNEIVYKKIDIKQFSELFIKETEAIRKINYICCDGNDTIGFANASYSTQNNVGYITLIIIAKKYRGMGVGKLLINKLEAALREVSNNRLEKFDITFFNPINLTWCVPGTPNHDHPNAPGVDVSCEGYIFLKNCGYRDTVYQNSFYQPLQNFEFTDKIRDRLASLSENELSIAFYDKDKHFGLDELFTDLGNEQWREIIMGNVQKDDAYPVLIAEHNGRAVGFTGPLYVQPSGRGYFAGIGIHSEYRKYGLGKALFSSLCMELKNMGADFMTLFTGETNPARNIYESAGFKIVKTWADMEKVIKE